MTATAPASRPLEWAARAMGGTIVQPGTRGTHFAGVNHDSRAVAPGQLFFALPASASTASTSRPGRGGGRGRRRRVARRAGYPPAREGVTVIAVDDPRRALGDLARAARAAFRGQVVGVTGSNGKTTTKELCAAALGPLGAVCAPRAASTPTSGCR